MPADERPRRLPLDLPLTTPLPLASGELEEADAGELRALKDQILRAVGFQCASYKEKCLRRRIAVRMRARAAHTYGDYAQLLREDPAEYGRLLDALTINVSKFYRNPEVWSALQELVLPELYALSTARLQIWSAGCAGGEEPYSAAMVCHDYALAHGHDPEKHRVLGTDVDATILSFAQRAEYSSFAMTDIPDDVRDRWFETGASFRLRPAARRHVRFEQLDLLREEYPRNQHLIFCRNVIIYFERPLQEALFRRFHAALQPGGFLVLGKVEALFGSATGMFRTISARQRIFRRE
jgi:chemotaxis methyl-accepting protein methylase